MAASFNQQKSIEKQTTDTAETVPESKKSKEKIQQLKHFLLAGTQKISSY